MPTLTLTEARQRARLLDVQSYRIDLDLTRGPQVLGSTTVVTFTCADPGASTFIELVADRLHRATLNGTDLDPAALVGNRLALPDLAAHNELVVVADLAYSTSGQGPHRFDDPADGETYVGVYCGTDLAHRVFACFDQPDLKARLEVSATAPAGWTVVGNGIGEQSPADPTRWSFAATPPVSSYLFVLVAGPWHSRRAEHRGVPFALHCRASLAEHLDRDVDELFGVTFACFDRYLELFDEPYAFDSYDQAFVPGLTWGALETPGCITFRDELVFTSPVTGPERQVRAVTIAHEMAHLWFGDLVTMRWWDDLWLSESFADYWGTQIVAEATRFTDAWTYIAIMRKAWGYDADQRSTTHPIALRPEDVADTESALANADGITYAKGAAALRQLVAWLGRDAFLRGVNVFLTRHRFGSATLADLIEALSAASGRDVGVWAAAWLETTGVDTLRAERDGDRLVIERLGTRPHVVSVGVFDAGLARIASLDTEIGSARTLVVLPAGTDLALVNDGDLSFCKVRLDDASWARAANSLSAVVDPLSRAVLWVTARDLVRDGDLSPTAYLDLVTRHLAVETDPSLVETVLGYARLQVVEHYLTPHLRPAALEQLADVARALIATVGADVRLAAVRTLIDCDGWPEGEDAPDVALRWRVLLRRCVLGLAGAADIAAALELDPGAGGHEAALRCAAARPDPAAKEAAFDAMLGSGALSGREFTATAQGFWWPEQADLLAPYVTRYFEVVPDVARDRGEGIADQAARVAFPQFAIDPMTLDAGRRCQGRRDLPLNFARGLADRLDDLERALRVRLSKEPDELVERQSG